MMRLPILLLLAWSLPAWSLPAWSLPAWGGELHLEGDFMQGGLVFGSTLPGAKVRLGERQVRVSPAGRFVIGFGRDAESVAELAVTAPDGETTIYDLDIEDRQYRVQRIDGLPPKMVTPPEEVLARIRRENAEIARVRKFDSATPYYEEGFIWPARGRISGVYGSQRILNGQPRRPHYGIDIAAPTGTAVVAPAGGVVTLAEEDLYYTGGTLIIDHGHGLSSAFLHMDSLAVSLGQEVKRGDPIGTVGASGRATGPHLDWRINWFNRRIDPALLVRPMAE